MRLSAAGAGLDVDETVVRVGRFGEHALEFEVCDRGIQRPDVLGHCVDWVGVVFRATECEQFSGVLEALADVVQAADGAVEGFLLASQLLRAPSVIPQLGILERGVDFDQSGVLGIEVKDTSTSLRYGHVSPPAWLRGR